MKYQPPFKYGVTPVSAGIHSDIADAPYVNGDPVTGDEGSIPPAEAFEHPMREILAVIEDADIAPDHEDLTQLLQALKKLARAEVKLKTQGGGIAVYNGRDDADFHHRIRSLRAGSNVTISIDTDGAILISAAGGGGGGGADTTSGLGVQVNVDTTADLAYQRLPAGGGTRADADTMAWRKDADGVHETMTWAQLRALLDARVATYVTVNNIGGTDVLNDAWNDTAGGFHTLGAATPTFNLPDVDLTKVGGILTVSATAREVATPNGSLVIEMSANGGSTWFPLAEYGWSGGYGGGTIFTASGGVYIGRLWFEWRADAATGARRMAYQTMLGPTPPAVTEIAITTTVMKLRARYTGTGSPLRIHGQRIVSDQGRPTLTVPPPGYYDYSVG